MGMKQVHFWIDEYIADQFQKMYPRQGKQTVEQVFRDMVNQKLEITDEEAENLQNEIKERTQNLEIEQDNLTRAKTKLNAYEAKKRQEVMNQTKQQKEYEQAAKRMSDSVKASGILEEVDLE